MRNSRPREGAVKGVRGSTRACRCRIQSTREETVAVNSRREASSSGKSQERSWWKEVLSLPDELQNKLLSESGEENNGIRGGTAKEWENVHEKQQKRAAISPKPLDWQTGEEGKGKAWCHGKTGTKKSKGESVRGKAPAKAGPPTLNDWSKRVTSECTLLSSKQLKRTSEEFAETWHTAHKNYMRNSWKTAHEPLVVFPNVYKSTRFKVKLSKADRKAGTSEANRNVPHAEPSKGKVTTINTSYTDKEVLLKANIGTKQKEVPHQLNL